MQRKFFTVLTAATMLSACQSSHEGYTLQCPKASIIYDLSRQAQTDSTNKISAEVHIDKISPMCKMDEESMMFTLSMRPGFTVARRAKGKRENIEAKYFIAIADLNGQIIDKHLYDLKVDFDADSRKEHLRVEDIFEYKFNNKSDLDNKQFYIGMQLTDKQVDANKARRSR